MQESTNRINNETKTEGNLKIKKYIKSKSIENHRSKLQHQNKRNEREKSQVQKTRD